MESFSRQDSKLIGDTCVRTKPRFHLLLAQQQEQECTVSLSLSVHNLPRNSTNISKLRASSQKQYGQRALVPAQSPVDISYFHVTTLAQGIFMFYLLSSVSLCFVQNQLSEDNKNIAILINLNKARSSPSQSKAHCLQCPSLWNQVDGSQVDLSS